jgi:general secretion pathway protein L
MASPNPIIPRDRLQTTLAGTGQSFFRWYANQTRALVPRSMSGQFGDRDHRIVVSFDEPNSAVLRVVRGTKTLSRQLLDTQSIDASLVADVRAGSPRTLNQAAVFVELPADRFLVRQFDVPAAAREHIPRLLIADIERKTPFQPAEVVNAHIAKDLDRRHGKLTIVHWIIPRDRVEALIAPFGLTLDDVDYVIPTSGEPDFAPPVIPTKPPAARSRLARNTGIALACSAVMIVAAGTGLTWWEHRHARNAVEAQIVTASAKAAAIRATVDNAQKESRHLSAMRLQKQLRPGFIEIWEELSRLLPDGTWVSELNMTEGKPDEPVINVVGFSDAATSVVPTVARSPMFSDVALTSAVTLDQVAQRERFSIRVGIRPVGLPVNGPSTGLK